LICNFIFTELLPRPGPRGKEKRGSKWAGEGEGGEGKGEEKVGREMYEGEGRERKVGRGR